ncbi:MAG: glycosyltransferase family 4 protein [Aurantimonas endophytica]|uniref:glycosyltransferase family 4 protein n=1 Tax=Aurantimonas endophytica TaxID=1522175 RepID=UPI0030018FD2
MGRPVHLLFVSSLLPTENPTTGFEIANQAIIAAYRRQGIELSFAGFRRRGSGEAAASGSEAICLGDIALENAGAGRARKALWLAGALARGLPVTAAKLAGLSQLALLARLGKAGPIDGLILNSLQMPTAYPFLTEFPAIFIAHNVEHHSAEENAANAGKRATRLLYRREAHLLKRAEQRLCREAAVVHTLSAEDGAGLGLAVDPKCLPLVLTVGRRQTVDDGHRDHDIGLIGTWSWAPNRVGLDWFLGEVVPRLPGDLTVAIAGRLDGPPPATPTNVAFLGRVDDAQRFVRGSRVLALATRGGTGVQLKTIEAFEEGMPAVATPQALRGVATLPPNVDVADDPAEFAALLATRVAAERAGADIRLDGSAFAASQQKGLDAGIAAGLALFSRGLALSRSATGTDGGLQPAFVGSAN